MWPRGAWAGLYEPLIRRAAGSARRRGSRIRIRYAQRFAHCDVLVVGAGPAGLAAARAALEAGARVILCDEQAEPAGRCSTAPPRDRRPDQRAWLRRALAGLAGSARITLLRARRPSAISRTTTSASSSG
jgi:sarcosine oxidase subunit alpha